MYTIGRHNGTNTRPLFQGRTRPILIDASLEAADLNPDLARKGHGLRGGFDVYSISLGLSPEGRLLLVPGRGLKLSLLNSALPSQGGITPDPKHHMDFSQLLGLLPKAHFQIDIADTSPLLRTALKTLVLQHGLHDRICLGSRFDAVGEALLEEFPTVPHFFPRAALARWSFSALLNQNYESNESYQVLNLPMTLESLDLVTEELINAVRAAGLWLNVVLPDDPKQRQRLFNMNVHGLIFGKEQQLITKQASLSPQSKRLKSA